MAGFSETAKKAFAKVEDIFSRDLPRSGFLYLSPKSPINFTYYIAFPFPFYGAILFIIFSDFSPSQKMELKFQFLNPDVPYLCKTTNYFATEFEV